MMRIAKYLTVLLLIVGSLSLSTAQNDDLETIIFLLQQADEALENNDLATAQALVLEAQAFITDEILAACPSMIGFQVLLDQILAAQDAATALELLNAAQTIAISCADRLPTSTAEATAAPVISGSGNAELDAALARARAFTGTNADWEPFYWTFDDGVEMVLVPAGCFMMGSTAEQVAYAVNELDAPPEWVAVEQPAHQQCFDEPFWLDRTEVTQGDFERLGGVAGRASYFSGDQRPVERITWFEARDFCALRGGRLPTEREWEYAARGPDSWIYPWGDILNAGNAVWNRSTSEGTASVGSRPAGASWVGALDMSGNVWEWTSSWYAPYPYAADDGREADTGEGTDVPPILRGGAWIHPNANYLRASLREGYVPDDGNNVIGVRCARDAAALPATANEQLAAPTATATVQDTAQVAATQTSTANPNPVIARNADWTPVIEEFDGVEMVLVPAGCFMMGSTAEQVAYAVNELDAPPEWVAVEQPAHQQCFDEPFWLDRTEVTQGDFERLGGVAGRASYFSGDQRPVERITWFEARDFCALRGGRLPTEREWEYAARGPDSWIYPWGDALIADNAVWNRSTSEGTASVGSRPAGVSWVGALDMSGNVREWTSSLIAPYPYAADDGREADIGERRDVWRVLRGGGWDVTNSFIPFDLRATVRGENDPLNWFNSVGMRCARDAE